jgi:membrane protease YdiL (CAAX protease family)
MAKVEAIAESPWGIGATVVWAGIACAPFALFYLLPSDTSSAPFEALRILAQLFSLAVVVAAARLAGWHACTYLGLSQPAARDVSLGIGVKLALLLASFVVLSVIGEAGATAGGADTVTVLQWTAYFATLALFWVSSVLVGPVCEEVVWRGFVYRGLAASLLGPAGAILAISPIFAMLHFYGRFGAFWVLLCALLYGWLRWRTNSLTAPIAAHAAGNGVAAAFATYEGWTAG